MTRRKVQALNFMARLVTWVLGCAAFDGALQLTGAWLMLGGAVTWMICDSVGRAVDAIWA